MSEPAKHLTPHPIDELFEAADERVGLPERDQVLAERGVMPKPAHGAILFTDEKHRRHREAARRKRAGLAEPRPWQVKGGKKADVRANGSGEQR